MKENSFFKKISLFIVSIGPGLFLVGYNIGTGSITTMASAGAAHGMMLTWAVLISCVFTYILIVTFGRFTLITGQTSIQSFKNNFGNGSAIFVLVTIIFSEMVSSIGVMAVVVQSVQEWSRPFTESGNGFNPIILAAFFALLIVTFLFVGRYSFIEKILSLFVALMGLCFVLTTFIVIPDASEVIKGLIPNIPHGANAGLLAAGMIGTTMGGVLYIVRSVTVKQKKWNIKDLKLEKRDAFISSSLMFVLSIAVMAAAAGTLYPKGLHIENAIDMIKLLQPLAGRFAISIFVAGIVCAGLSSLFPHYMLVPLLWSDYRNSEFTLKAKSAKAIVIFYAALGLVVPVFGGRPVFVMIVSQVFALIVTPVVLIFMLLLQNKEKLMGKYKASKSLNVTLIIIILFTIFMAIVGIIGISSL